MEHKSKAQKNVSKRKEEMIYGEELKNAANLLNELDNNFEELTSRETKERLGNAAFIINNLIFILDVAVLNDGKQVVYYEELKSINRALTTTYDRFEELTPRQIKQDIDDITFLINHLVEISSQKQNCDATIRKVPMETVEIINLAEAIYDWMKSLTSKEGLWVVDNHEFLPANVLCDHHGKMILIHGLANAMEKYLENKLVVTKKRVSQDKKGSRCIGIYLLEP